MFIKAFASLALVFAIFLSGLTAQAHTADQGYIYFEVTETALTGRFEVAYGDLGRVVDLDADGDGSISDQEVADNLDAIFVYLQSNIVLRSDGAPLVISQTTFDVRDVEWEKYAKVYFDVRGLTPVPESIEVTYNLFFDAVGPNHAGFVIIDSSTRTGVTENEADFALILTDGSRTKTLSLVGKPLVELLVHFIKEGIWNMWQGLDHVLFLLTLLIPTVMAVTQARWTPSDGLYQPAMSVLKLGIAFALGHSITLGLASMGFIQPPAWITESLIALSIAYVALTVLVPRLHVNMVLVVAVLGLFHGFGFANALAPISIEPNQKLVTWVGFNIGIELGLIAIVLVVFPVFYILRHTKFYQLGLMKIAMIVLGLASLIWSEERAFDLMGPVFGNIKSMIGS